MGVRRVGVEIVAEGVQQAIQQANQFGASVTGIGDAAKVTASNVAPLTVATGNVAQALAQLQQASGTISNAIQLLGTTSSSTASQVEKIDKAAVDAGKGLSTLNLFGIPVVFTLRDIKDSIQGVIQPFVNLGRQAFGAVASYQQLAMSMESLVAKEIRAADSTIEMTDALEQAKPRAKELLTWIQQLAINSPFDQAGVAQAFRTAQAYGFTAAEAQRLTKATIDFASATGQGSFEMQRISLALGQIKAKGKVAQQELNQLTQTGIAIAPVFEKMGISMNDVSKGTVGAGEFIKAFTEMLESDFAGAAARTTNTLEGLTSTLADLKTVGLRSLTLPFFEALTPVLSSAIGSLNNFMPVLELAGQYIGQFTTYLIENKEAVLSVVATITAGVGSFLLVSNYSLVAGAAYSGFTAILAGSIGILGTVATAIGFILSPIGLLSIAVGGLAALFVVSFSTMQDMMQSMAVSSEKSTSLMDASFGTLSQSVNSTASSFLSSTQIMDGTFRDATTGIESSSKKMEESVMANFSAMGVNVSNEVQKSSAKVVADWGEQGDKVAQIAAQQTEDSHSWGYNLIMQFANGMASAAKYIIKVLNDIGQQIAHWLAPGSPPRITPDIDKWGEEAMGQFVKGFTKADFGQLKNLSGTIKSYLGSLGEDVLDQKDLIPTLLGSREAIAEAIAQIRETGSVGSDSIQKIIDSIGVASPELETYITSLLNVEQTNQAVTAASEAYAAAQAKVVQSQEALNAVSEKYNAILAPMNEELAAIAEKREQFQTSQRVGVLQSILADKNAPAIAKELAMMELREIQLKQQIKDAQKAQKVEEEAAQSAIDNATEEADAAKENLDTAVSAAEQAQLQIELQKEILDLQIETNNMYKDQAGLLEKLNKDTEDALDSVGSAAHGATGKVGQLGAALSDLANGASTLGAEGGPMSALKKKFDEFSDDITKPFDGIQDQLKELKETWATVFLELSLKLQPVTDALETAWGEGGTWSGNFDNIKTIMESQWGEGGTWSKNADNLKIIWDAVEVAWNEQWGEGGTWEGIMDNASKIQTSEWGSGGTWEKNTDNLSKITTTLHDMWDDQWGEDGTWQGIMENASTIHTEQWGEGGTWDGVMDNAKKSLDNLSSRWNHHWGIGGTWEGIIKNAKGIFSSQWGVGGTWEGIFDNAKTAVGLVTTAWDEQWGIGGTWDGIMKNANLVISTNWGEGGVWDGIYDNVKEGVKLVADKFSEKIDLIKGYFDDLKEKINTKIAEIIASITTIFETTNWAELGLSIITGIVNGIVNNASRLYNAIKDLIADAIADALAGLGGGGGGASPQGTANGFANASGGSVSGKGFTTSGLPSMVSLPSTVAPPVSYNRSVVNNNQFQGIGHADVNNGMDVQNLQAIIEMTVMRVMQNQGYGA